MLLKSKSETTKLKNNISDLSEDQDDNSDPEICNNNIYFYCKVSTNSILNFNKKLRELDQKNYLDAVSRQSVFDNTLTINPIVIYIQSPGGDLLAGLSAMDTILQCKSPIYTVIDGHAASAATLMSVVGTKRFITPHSFSLIHQLSSGTWGRFEEMEDEMGNLKLFMSKLKEVYIKYTKISGKQLDDILKKDIYFDAEKSLELGIVDFIK
jgi:ATP-dependent protease ClpP protease subunit